MSLPFTHVPSFACRGGLQKSRADCSAIGLYCVTITWQQTCKDSLYISVTGVLLHVRLPDVLDRQELSLNLLSKLVMSLIIEKHLVVLEYFPASLKILEYF